MKMLLETGHFDGFVNSNTPTPELQPEFNVDLYPYQKKLNVGVELADALVERGFGEHSALVGSSETISYQQLCDLSNQIARVLSEDFGIVSGNRVMIRSRNCPMMVACFLAILKVGAVAFNTIALMRAKELSILVDKAKVDLVLCQKGLEEELNLLDRDMRPNLKIAEFSATIDGTATVNAKAACKSTKYEAVKTSQNDIALLASTSGTTGKPKITMHRHRDILAIADGFARQVLKIVPDDICIGTPPLAFTFGLGGLAVFPLRFGATAVLLEQTSPTNLAGFIGQYGATVCFSAPTAYKVILSEETNDKLLKTLRCAVSAGENLPQPVLEGWQNRINVPIINAMGSTEALHTFISTRLEDFKSGSSGLRPIEGYEVEIFDDDMKPAGIEKPGWLGFRGPTGCRYMDDDRQAEYVKNGWNITGDFFRKDRNGKLHFVSRADDMIISSGYNIAAAEVEEALLSHPYVRECAVVGVPDSDRGSIVRAHVVLNDKDSKLENLVETLQEHVKSAISPYKYPRSIIFGDSLPKTETGKLKRHMLRKAEIIKGDCATEKDSLIGDIASDPTIGAGNFLFRVHELAANNERTAVTHVDFDGQAWGFSLNDLVAKANHISSCYWHLGIRAKSIVALYLEDGISYYLHYLALTKIGAIPAFLNGGVTPEIASKYLSKIKPELLVSEGERLDEILTYSGNFKCPTTDIVEVEKQPFSLPCEAYEHSDDDTVLISHTSGTTGLPKAVSFSQKSIIYGVKKQLGKKLGNAMLSAAPVSHAAAVTMLMSNIMRMNHLIIVSDKSPEGIAAAIETFEPSIMFAFPSVYVDLCRIDIDPKRLASINIWMSTADACHEPHVRKMLQYGHRYEDGKRVDGALFIDNLGSSEFAFGIFRNIHTLKTNNYNRCVGKPFSWIEVALFDEQDKKITDYGVVGRLGVKSPSVTSGYWDNQEATADAILDGYWLTGDLIYKGENGLYYHVDRTSDSMQLDGKTYYSCQLEESFLKNIPAIFDCTVVQGEPKGTLKVEVEVKEGLSFADIEQRISEFSKENNLPEISEIKLVSPGSNEGVTGKKLKRVIRETA
ncbi:AMP-binding protein [Pseudovibrio sp. Tun.PSC04-5.I4]|uniref:AMP-binding protein n=1 Tax=Pseudovibrio sp. Tun.PSC04-5.I4 TaxID=1798213 RepID=UPI00088FF537|nr:AMP-binding protein [Pseudovibrio sp. Tun.PSC04-5.I4]SDQ32205.1 Acyl-coenzyme A synthetase/AMP-(fatty) acid ligase [Pseudovibrio sp. Tun.PSC04-5.I4]